MLRFGVLACFERSSGRLSRPTLRSPDTERQQRECWIGSYAVPKRNIPGSKKSRTIRPSVADAALVTGVPSHRLSLSTLLVPLTFACTPTNPPAPSSGGLELAELPTFVEPGPAASPSERAGVSAESLTATFIPQYDLIARGPDGAQHLNFMIRLVGDDQGTTARPSVDLAIVLDRSGSMSGDKIRYAKQAGLELLARLETRDRVTLISYDSFVDTHTNLLTADSEGIDRLRRELLALEPGTATALGPALFAALDEFETRPPTADRLTHVVLLSDGLANQGESRAEIIGAHTARGYQHGTTVSTLGMGVDYNEDLMTEIADQGGGRYHFIEDATHIPAVLTDELAGLTSTIAADVSVEFAAHSPTHVDVVHGYVSTTEDDLTAIRVGYLSAGQTREIMGAVEIPAEQLRGQIGDVLELGEITVRFRPIDANAGEDAPLLELHIPATVTLGGSAEDVRRSEHTEVTVRVVEVESAATMRLATQAVDRGDWSTAERILDEADREFDEKLARANSKAEKIKLSAEDDAFEAARAGLEQAQHSETERKSYSKRNKLMVYEKGKGSTLD
jgi:Ca-activated chloride channel family protein